MKKVAVFNLREFDEAEWFEKYAGDLGLELSTCPDAVSYTHLRAHETRHDLVCRLLLEKKKQLFEASVFRYYFLSLH